MIKGITIQGLRGKDLTAQLEPLTLVVGPNKAGKTTIADAIRWALLGYIPGMDAPPRGWAELIGNGATGAEVQLHLEKSTVIRTLWLEKGAVKIHGPGSEWSAPVNVLGLDPAKFLEATGPKRAQMLAEATGAGFDWKALVPEELRDPVFKYAGAWPIWLEGQLEQAKTARGHWANDKKTLTATLRGLEGLREIVIGNDTGLKAKLDKHKEGIGSLKEQLRAVTKQIAKAKEPLPGSAQNQLDGIRRALQEFLGRSHDPDTYAERLTDCELRLKELQLDQPTTGPKGLEQLKVALRQEQNDAQLQVSRAGQLDERIKTIKAKYADLRKHKRCPTCGTAGKHLTAALNIAEKKELDDVSGLLREAEMMREAAHERLEEVGNKLVAAEEYWQKREALELMLGDLKDEGKLIELWKQHDLLVEKAQAEGQMYDLEALEGRRYDIQCELEDAEESAVEWEKELAEIGYKRSQRKQLAEIERRLAEAEAGWEKQNKHVHELEALRARLTAMSMEPILKTLGIFTAGIFEEPLSLEGSELGRMVGSRWVPLSQFSGSEQAVAVAALSCALKADPKRQNLVLADELSSFDDVHLGQFLKNVAAAIQAGVIEQFIGFSIPRKTIKNLPQTVSLRAIGK